jgi:RNA polymerase sigma factor (sigma-70 family)
MKHDFELLRAYVYDASESAFSALVERYLQLVYSSALRQLGGDEHRARDVAQAVFTLLAQKAGSLVDHPQIVGWLYRTTYNFAAKARRAEWRRVVREQHAYFMEEIQRGSDSVAWEEIRTVIDWGLKGLSEFDRDLVLRRYFVGQSLAEIGLTAGLTEGAARMRVDRALEKLRIRLARRGVTSTSGALTLAFSHVAYGAAPPAFVASITTAALSGAAAVPVGLTMGFGIFAIMNKATTATIALVFAAVATGVAVTQSQRARRAGATVVSLQRELAAVEARRASLANDHIVERAGPEVQRRVEDASAAVASVTPSPSSIHQGKYHRGVYKLVFFPVSPAIPQNSLYPYPAHS